MEMTATRGGTSGSNRAGRHHRSMAEALEVWLKPGRGWSCGDDPRGSPASSSSGTAARDLPGRAMAFYWLVECVSGVDDAREGWGGLYL